MRSCEILFLCACQIALPAIFVFQIYQRQFNLSCQYFLCLFCCIFCVTLYFFFWVVVLLFSVFCWQSYHVVKAKSWYTVYNGICLLVSFAPTFVVVWHCLQSSPFSHLIDSNPWCYFSSPHDCSYLGINKKFRIAFLECTTQP